MHSFILAFHHSEVHHNGSSSASDYKLVLTFFLHDLKKKFKLCEPFFCVCVNLSTRMRHYQKCAVVSSTSWQSPSPYLFVPLLPLFPSPSPSIIIRSPCHCISISSSSVPWSKTICCNLSACYQPYLWAEKARAGAVAPLSGADKVSEFSDDEC